MKGRDWLALFAVGLLLGCLVRVAFGGYAAAIAVLALLAYAGVVLVTAKFLKATAARQTSPVDADAEQAAALGEQR